MPIRWSLTPVGSTPLVADLGLDKIMIYHLDTAHGKLDLRLAGSVQARAGSGPRHLALHPNGRYCYCTNELDSTLSVFAIEPGLGRPEEVQVVSLLPPGYRGDNSPAHVRIDASGRFVYASNRGHDSIAIFAVEPESGRVTAHGHESTRGEAPRSFTLTPGGQFLIAGNEHGGNVATFSIDAASGGLDLLGVISVPCPLSILALPAASSSGNNASAPPTAGA